MKIYHANYHLIALILLNFFTFASCSKEDRVRNDILDEETLRILRGTSVSETKEKNKIVNFHSLWDEYYDDSWSNEEVKEDIGGRVNASWIQNTCTIRLSKALNYSNNLIFRKEFQIFGKKYHSEGLVVSGDDRNWYAPRVAEMALYLTRKYFKPIVFQKPKSVVKKLKSKKNTLFRENIKSSQEIFYQILDQKLNGIIMFNVPIWEDATGHFDIIRDGLHFKGHTRLLEASEVFIWVINPSV